jgi:hypothetical protein
LTRLLTPIRLTEFAPLQACHWVFTIPPPPNFPVTAIVLRYEGDSIGTGLPGRWGVTYSDIVVWPGGPCVYQAAALVEVTEQFSCRALPDFEMVPDTQPACAFGPPTAFGGPLLAKWGGLVSPF